MKRGAFVATAATVATLAALPPAIAESKVVRINPKPRLGHESEWYQAPHRLVWIKRYYVLHAFKGAYHCHLVTTRVLTPTQWYRGGCQKYADDDAWLEIETYLKSARGKTVRTENLTHFADGEILPCCIVWFGEPPA